MDSDGAEIHFWDVRGDRNDVENTYQIGENEEIVGIYGYSNWSFFKNFGFIVKTKRGN